MKDKAGRDIRPEDLIVYAQSFGRCASLNYGKVTRLSLSPRVPELGQEQVEVIDFVGLCQNYKNGEPYWGLQNPSVLRFSQRILVVQRQQVPQDVLDVLDTVKPT